MSALEVGEAVLAAGLLLVTTAVVVLVLRRRAVAAGYPLKLAATQSASGRWRLGLLRLGPTSLGFYRVVWFTTRPLLEWDRAHLELSTPRDEDVSLPGLTEPVRVDVGDGSGAPCPLAVERGVYMAIRSWLESVPPGRDVNVA